jgi:hypothetical protein
MLPAVGLDNEPRFEADEIDDVLAVSAIVGEIASRVDVAATFAKAPALRRSMSAGAVALATSLCDRRAY